MYFFYKLLASFITNSRNTKKSLTINPTKPTKPLYSHPLSRSSLRAITKPFLPLPGNEQEAERHGPSQRRSSKGKMAGKNSASPACSAFQTFSLRTPRDSFTRLLITGHSTRDIPATNISEFVKRFVLIRSTSVEHEMMSSRVKITRWNIFRWI